MYQYNITTWPNYKYIGGIIQVNLFYEKNMFDYWITENRLVLE